MANVSVGSTTGLYGVSTTNSILTSAQNLYTLLGNSASVGFYLTNSNLTVDATTLPTGVASGTYGDGSDIPVVTVGADGRVTNITTVAVTAPASSYGNANVAAYLSSNTDPTIQSLNANTKQQQGQINVVTANVAAFETYANATYATNANLTAFETYANITYATNANLTAFETYANATFGTSSYGNANVAAYLPNYNGNIQVANVSVSQNINISNTNAPGYKQGTVWYDTTEDSLAYFNGVTNNIIHIGQETQFRAYNNTSSNIVQGAPVYVNGSFGSWPNIALAQANSYTTSQVAGVANQAIPAGSFGYVVSSGTVANILLVSYQAGDNLYLSSTTPGVLQNSVPTSGYVTRVGVVSYNGAQGRFITSVVNPVNNQTFSNLAITGNITTGNISSTNGFFWANGTAYSTGGGTTSTYSNANAQSYLSTTSVLNIGNAAPGGGQVVIGHPTTNNSVILQSGPIPVEFIVGSVGGNLSLSASNGLQINNTDLSFSSATGQGGNINMNNSSGRGYINSAAGVTAQTYTSTNGYFWANGQPYNTQPTYGNTQVNAYLQSNAITQILGGNTLTIEPQSGILDLIGAPVQIVGTGPGNATVITGGNIVLAGVNGSGSGSFPANVWIIGSTTQTGNITTSAGMYTTNGYFWANGTAYSTGVSTPAFSGNLAGNVLYDGINGFVTANAYPFSAPDTSVGSSYWNLYYQNPKPVYSGGVLQPPSPSGLNGILVNSQHVANIAMAHAASTQTVIGNSNYIQVWPGNSGTNMTNNDRVRALNGIAEVNLQGGTWGTMSSSSQSTALIVGMNGFTSITGTGQLASTVGQFAGAQVVPKGGSANVQYATAVLGSVTFSANAVNNYTTSNIAYARLFAGSLSPTGNLVMTNAVGLHTVSGWAGSGSVVTNQRYVVLNEDAATILQTNGNIVFTSGSAKGIVFQDGSYQTTAATSGTTYSNANVASYLPTSSVNFGGNILTVTGNATITAQSNVVDMSINTGGLGLPIGGNSARPTTATPGTIRFNSDTMNPEWYDAVDNVWKVFSQTYTPPLSPYSIRYLVVAGGGGAGASDGGGGGAGGLLAGNITGVTVGTTFSVTVGAGGSGSNSTGTSGSNSTLTTITTALGGGAGGGGGNGSSGGSGGGSGNGGSGGTGGSGTSGQGNVGGNAVAQTDLDYPGGGGGGAGGVGSDGVTNAAGDGGVGIYSDINGAGTYYGGGGGGAIFNVGTAGTGGTGGGGNGGSNFGGATGGNGTAGTGGGAGGGAGSGAPGGNGGSGVVVLSVPTANYSGTISGTVTVTTSGSNTILTFTGSGSYTS